jgi:prepilin-type N-terminal cleavage/methylation domain-containing protein
MAKRPAQRGERGFSMVELLVTIIIAGIFFAAMVPVFVMATQQSSTDRARILATNTVQSTIERLRDLPYDVVRDTKWNVITDDEARAVEGVLGQSLHWKGSNSNLKVVVLRHHAIEGSEDYLVAAVTADWTGQGGHKRTIMMKTVIYRQGLGTETLVLLVYPLFNGFIKVTPVTVSVQLNAGEAAQVERIDVTVYANNGTRVEQWSIDTKDSVPGPDGSSVLFFNHPWLAEGLADGRYSFVAKTVPKQPAAPGDPVPPSEWATKEYVLDRLPPGKPVIQKWEAGFQTPSPGATPTPPLPFVYLSWGLEPNVSDLDHFEVGRTGTAADGFTLLPEKIIELPKWSTEYVDRDVLAGASYVYKVLAQDAQEQRGFWSDSAGVSIPSTSSDVTTHPPLGPIRYTVEDSFVKLTWGASESPPSVDAYRVYRVGADGVRLLVQTVPSTLPTFTCTDISVEYGETYTYFVTGVTYVAAVPPETPGLQWESLSTSGAPVRVPEPPMVGMRVDVQVQPPGLQVPTSARLMIHSLDTGDIIPANPWDYPTIDPGSSNVSKNTWVTGNILYPGVYQVIAVFYSSNKTTLGTYTSDAVTVSSPDTPVHVPYLGPN